MAISNTVGPKAELETPNYEFMIFHDVRKAYDKNLYMFNHGGSVGQIMKYSGLNDSGMSESDYKELLETITRVIVATASPDVTICFHMLRNTHFEKMEIPKDIPVHLKERHLFLQELIKEGEVFNNEFYISVNCWATDDSLSLLDKGKIIYKNALSVFTRTTDISVIEKKQLGIKRRITKVSQTMKTIQASFKPLGINAKIFTEKQEYWNLLRKIVGPSVSKDRDNFYVSESEPNESPRQALMSGITIKEGPDHLTMDDYLFQVYELDRISSRTSVNHKDILNLVNAPYEFFYTVAISCMDYNKSNKLFAKALGKAKTEVDLATDASGNVSDPGLVYDYQAVAQSYNEMAERGLGATQYASTMVIRQKMKTVQRLMREQNIDLISDYIFDFKERVRQQIFSRFGQSEWSLVDLAQVPMFGAFLPGMCSISSKKMRILIDAPSNIPYMLPMYSQKRDDLDYYGFNHFFSDSMGLTTFENFDTRLPSWGTLVSGDMGSGKSVCINLYLSMAYTSQMVSGKPPILRIVDYGGATSSYFKLIKLLNGSTLKFTGANLPCFQIMELVPDMSYPTRRKLEEINTNLRNIPSLSELSEEDIDDKIISFFNMKISSEDEVTEKFLNESSLEIFGVKYQEVKGILELAPGECKPDSEKMRFLMSVFEVMLSNNPETLDAFSTDFTRDDVQLFINRAYEITNDRFPRITDVYNIINEYNKTKKSPNLSKMSIRLSQWTVKEGSNKMFDRPTNVDMSNNAILFDLFGLDSNPHLQAIYMLVITNLITKDMYEKMDRMRIVTLDEVWASAKTEAMQDVLSGFFRLSRKYKFQPVMASQLPTDYYDLSQKFGDIIVSQARNYIICGISDDRIIEKTKAIYNLTDEQAAEIKKLGVGENPNSRLAKRYGRFMHIAKLSNSRSTSIFKSVLSPFEFALINSNKEDNAIARYYLDKQKMDIVETCRLITDEKYKGDEGLIEFLRLGNHPVALKMVMKK